jgi:hypothetical protein
VPVSVPRVLVVGCGKTSAGGLLAAAGRLHLAADWADTAEEAAALLRTHHHTLLLLFLNTSSAKFNAADFIRCEGIFFVYTPPPSNQLEQTVQHHFLPVLLPSQVQILFLKLSIWYCQGLVNYIDIKAKCRHLKNLTGKETLRQVLISAYRLEIQ